MTQRRTWDIFCRVIDNFGDIGVCWRLAAALASRGQHVRLWADDASALAWMAPSGCDGVEVRNWQPDQPMPQDARPGDVVIEAFGCEINHTWLATDSIAPHADSMLARGQNGLNEISPSRAQPLWINLEYLSAENDSHRNHGLASPVLSGAAKGATKWFFYPGFTAATGGLIREPETKAAEMSSDDSAISIHHISLFCYEPAALSDLMQLLADGTQPHQLHVLAGRGQAALAQVYLEKNSQKPAWNKHSMLSINEHPYMPQPQYDALLQSCHFNFVRGEDSLVRALWAGRAFVWQIYPQSDGAHAAKLEAFLDWLQAPPDLREFHRIWNGLQHAALPTIRLHEWTACAKAARSRLLAQRDLVSQLLDFVEEKTSSVAAKPAQNRIKSG